MPHAQDNVQLWIVLADDDVEYHELVKRAAKECNLNHLISSVYNGRQLLDLLLKKGVYKTEYNKVPDGILLDLEMKVEGGYKALEVIKTTPSLKDIPVYIITKGTSAMDKETAIKLGARDFMEKPVDIEDIKRIIFKLCRRVNGGQH
jgi:CheY-like chemotaxis protein